MVTPMVESPAGLPADEAAARLARDGFNELPSAKPRNLLAIAADVAREPMFLLLIACGAIYLLLGDRGEAAMLLGFVLVIISIIFVQEHKTERALAALRDLSSPRTLVVRDGEQRRIPGREVVRGDLLILSEGDRVPADATLLSGTSLATDESLLTGESVPVTKLPAPGLPERLGSPGGGGLGAWRMAQSRVLTRRIPALEMLGSATVLCVDKTGTLTQNRMPVHILFLQLIIDPACSIVFEAEPEDADTMRKPPRLPGTSLFNRGTVVPGILQGLAVFVALLAVYGIELHRGQSIEEARALAFTAMVLASVGLILTSRSTSLSLLATIGRRNAALWWIVSGVLAFLALVLYVPTLQELFKFGRLHSMDFVIAAAAGIGCIAASEFAKRIPKFGKAT
jgi:magnesium-transporting ATPase (P-type)